jgi:hypothetical protein
MWTSYENETQKYRTTFGCQGEFQRELLIPFGGKTKQGDKK